jgi:serine/threonine protein kinase
MEHKDSGTSQTTTGATSFMGTLFTKTTGISKPAYLEANSNEFRMIKQIAQGGGGVIFIGEFLSGSKSALYGKTIIIKKLADSYDKLSKPSKDAFDQEISLMDFFRNEKHIAKIYGYSHAPCCIIMKFYHNQSLDVWIQRNPGSSMRKRSQFALDIAQGINTMHSKSIAHNDLKPQNVLLDLDSNGRLFCVITDFGISHILSEKVISAKAFSAVWLRGVSARYASPEAYERFRKHSTAPAEVYKAGDIYCFAGILYDFLTAASPWSKATV